LSTFAIGLNRGDVPVQSSHDTDPREHRWPAEGHDQQQRFHCRLPLLGIVLSLGSLVI
jgi:hypothetical protein